jgi:outer membrane lipoprotein carrier protein
MNFKSIKELHFNQINLIRYLLLSLLILVSPVSDASPVKLLVKKLANYKSFEANFTQYVSDKTGMRVQDTQGKVKVMRPGKFYWHTYPPVEQVVVSDGKQVTVYDPDLEQATIQPVSKDISATPALLLSGDVDNIKKHFTVDFRKDRGTELFLLTPKSPDSLFMSLTLRFKNNRLEEMRMADSLGQKSVIGFNNIVLNPNLPSSAFQLKLPPDTDIIRDKQK